MLFTIQVELCVRYTCFMLLTSHVELFVTFVSCFSPVMWNCSFVTLVSCFSPVMWNCLFVTLVSCFSPVMWNCSLCLFHASHHSRGFVCLSHLFYDTKNSPHPKPSLVSHELRIAPTPNHLSLSLSHDSF